MKPKLRTVWLGWLNRILGNIGGHDGSRTSLMAIAKIGFVNILIYDSNLLDGSRTSFSSTMGVRLP